MISTVVFAYFQVNEVFVSQSSYRIMTALHFLDQVFLLIETWWHLALGTMNAAS